MADKDTITKEYMQDNETFADAFNFLLYDGEQVIKPERLKPLDTTAIVKLRGNGSNSALIQKYRDLLKMATVMSDGEMAYIVLGIENQTDLHYAMPVREMLYDAVQYSSQVDAAAKEHRKNGDTVETSAEFLSGFYKIDRLIPVITLTLYFGPEEWASPKSLHEMLALKDKNLLKFIPDYRLNLITPKEISDENFEKFHTELKAALKYVKYSKDRNSLERIVRDDTAYKSISRRTADMLNIITGSDLKYREGEEKIDMCKAIEDMRNESLEKGRAEGMEKGRAEGMEKGMEKGVEKGTIMTLISLVKDGLLPITEAAKRAGMTVDELKNRAELLAAV